MNWERTFTRPLLQHVEGNAGVFLEILARRAENHPDSIELFIEAMAEMATWAESQSAGLRSVVELRRLAKQKKP